MAFIYSYSSLIYSQELSAKYIGENVLDPRNTRDKNSWDHEENYELYEIPQRKIFRPTRHQREKISDSRNTHEKIFSTHEKTFRTHETQRI